LIQQLRVQRLDGFSETSVGHSRIIRRVYQLCV
jgi:hypothetical protein